MYRFQYCVISAAFVPSAVFNYTLVEHAFGFPWRQNSRRVINVAVSRALLPPVAVQIRGWKEEIKSVESVHMVERRAEAGVRRDKRMKESKERGARYVVR